MSLDNEEVVSQLTEEGRRLFPLGPAETAIDAAKHKSFEEIRKGRGRNFARTQKTFVVCIANQFLDRH